jgi:hypothetical protein
MISMQEIDNIYAIESNLLETGVSTEEIVSRFSEFLLLLIEGGKIESSADSEIHMHRQCLLEISSQEIGEPKEKLRRNYIGRVWKIHESYRKNDVAISALARCVIYCFIDKDSWAMDNQGEETPIFYLYSDLVKLNPELANDFKDYFQVWGNH